MLVLCVYSDCLIAATRMAAKSFNGKCSDGFSKWRPASEKPASQLSTSEFYCEGDLWDSPCTCVCSDRKFCHSYSMKVQFLMTKFHCLECPQADFSKWYTCLGRLGAKGSGSDQRTLSNSSLPFPLQFLFAASTFLLEQLPSFLKFVYPAFLFFSFYNSLFPDSSSFLSNPLDSLDRNWDLVSQVSPCHPVWLLRHHSPHSP